MTTSVYELAPVTTHYRITANAGDPLDLLIPILDRDGDPVRITPGEVPLWSASAQVRRNVIACEVLHEWRTDGAAPNAEIVPGDPDAAGCSPPSCAPRMTTHVPAPGGVSPAALRWPEGCEPPPEWWRTPVGRMVARSIGHEDGESVSRSVAAAILGVHPGTVAQLLERGKLERHPDGGITRASVLARLASQTKLRDHPL